MTIEAVNETSAPATDFLPGPILLLGAPGVGKGTQAKLLMAQLGIPQISTGEILRANIAAGTDLGRQAKALMDQGQLVADKIVNEMVANRMAEPDAERGCILDGYPRTQQQVIYLAALLGSSNYAQGSQLVVIDIHVEESELLRRITGRRICSAGGHIYNIYSNPPKQAGTCDIDGSELQQRSDDTEQAFHTRMSEYNTKTAAVVRAFSVYLKKFFRSVDGELPIEEVQQAILAALRELRKGSN